MDCLKLQRAHFTAEKSLSQGFDVGHLNLVSLYLLFIDCWLFGNFFIAMSARECESPSTLLGDSEPISNALTELFSSAVSLFLIRYFTTPFRRHYIQQSIAWGHDERINQEEIRQLCQKSIELVKYHQMAKTAGGYDTNKFSFKSAAQSRKFKYSFLSKTFSLISHYNCLKTFSIILSDILVYYKVVINVFRNFSNMQ